MNNVVSGFNKFFVSIGPKLAEKINDPETTKEGTDYDYGDRN